MKRTFGLWIIAFLSLSFFVVFASGQEASSEKREGKVSAEEVLRNLDLDKNTKAHIQEYVKDTRGKTVYGKGKVVDVVRGRGHFRVRLKVEGNIPPSARGEYNVTLVTDNPGATDLKRGEIIKFEGTFQPRRGAFYGTTARQKVGLSVDNVVGDYTVTK